MAKAKAPSSPSPRASAYNWRALLIQASKGLESGEVAPTFRALSDLLDIPQATLRQGLQREFGLSASDLPGLPSRAQKILDSLPNGKAELPKRYKGVDPALILKILRGKPHTLAELADRLDRGKTSIALAVQAMADDGIGILISESEVSLPDLPSADPLPTLYDQPSATIRFGAFCDIHVGSKFAQISALRAFIHAAVEDYGVRRFLVPGDVVAGVGVYRGQHNELYAHGADDQADAACNTIPAFDDVEYVLLGGNHDYSLYRANGVDVVRMICNQRADFHYAGYDQAEVPLVQKDGQTIVSAILWHPSGGQPYALSYRGQKFAAEVARRELTSVILEQKPAPDVRFILWGHLHVSDFFPHGPIWVMGPGCFEGTTGYLKAKGLIPQIQGIIVEAGVTETGMINNVMIRAIPFAEQLDDYRCGWIPDLQRGRTRVEPLFSIDAGVAG